MILHVVNLTSEATWRAPVDELIRVGPFKVKILWSQRPARPTARLLVASAITPMRIENGFAVIDIESVIDHEVVVAG